MRLISYDGEKVLHLHNIRLDNETPDLLSFHCGNKTSISIVDFRDCEKRSLIILLYSFRHLHFAKKKDSGYLSFHFDQIGFVNRLMYKHG